MGRGQVLVVDDEPEVVELLAESLAGWGYEVLTAASIEEAQAVLTTTFPQAMLLDLRMPGTSGIDGLNTLRVQRPTVPIIVVTGIPEAEAGHPVAAFDVVMKPFDLEDLQQRLAAAVATWPRAH
jgi:CheY-like chemotaxis protein